MGINVNEFGENLNRDFFIGITFPMIWKTFPSRSKKKIRFVRELNLGSNLEKKSIQNALSLKKSRVKLKKYFQ